MTITGEFSGKMRQNLITLAALIEDCHDDTASICQTEVLYTFPWGGLLRVEEFTNGVGTLPGPFIGDVEYGIRLTAETGFGDTDTTEISITVTPAPSGVPTGDYGTDVTAAYTGTIEVTFQLETFLTPTIGGMPSYAGAESVDSPPHTDAALYERFVPGVAVSMEICADVNFTVSSAVAQPPGEDMEQSGCASASDTIATHEMVSGYAMTESVQVISVENDNVTVIAAVDDWLGPNSRPALDCTASAGGASGTASLGSLSAQVSINASGVCQGGYGSAVNTFAPDRTFEVSGVVRRMEEGYPGAQVQIWDGTKYQNKTATSDGLFTHSGTQVHYSGSVAIHVGDGDAGLSDDCDDDDSALTWGSVWVRLRASWMSAQMLDAALWPVLFRAFPAYPVFDLAQAAERTVLSAYSGAGPSDLSRTISLANGADTDLDGTDWSNFSLHGYAYLVLRVKASAANSGFTVKIGTKEWTKDADGAPLEAGTAFAEFVIDLLNPTNATQETNSKDSRFPYASSGPIIVQDADMWGVANASAIVLTDLDSETYDVDYVKLRRDGYSRVTALHGFNYWARDVADSDPNPVYYNLRLLTGDTDGCRSLEVIGFYKQEFAGVPTYTHRPIADVVDSINGDSGRQPADGWTATPETFDLSGCAPTDPTLPDLTPCWLNDERYAAWIEGAGAKYASGAWVYGWRLDCASAREFQAQMLFHRITHWPPALDDPLNLSAASVSGAIFLPCATILKARAVGVVFDDTPVRAADIPIEIEGGTYGSGTTEADGTYLTGTPYAPGGSAEVTADVGDEPPTLIIVFYPRTEKRACFRVVTEPCSGLSLDFSPAQRFVRANTCNGTIKLYFASDAAWTDWEERDTGIAGTDPEVRWERQGKRACLYLQYLDPDDVLWLLATCDEGGSAVMATTLATDVTQHTMAAGANQIIYSYWRDNDGALKGKQVNFAGTVLNPTPDETSLLAEGFEVISSDSPIDDMDIACAVTPGEGGSFVVVLQYYDGGDLMQIVSTDGRNFT